MRALERERRDLDGPIQTVAARDLQWSVCRPSVDDSPNERQVIDGHGNPITSSGSKGRGPRLEWQVIHLLEAHAEQSLRGFVEVHEIAPIVDEEDRHGQRSREVPEQDQLNRLLRHGDRPPNFQSAIVISATQPSRSRCSPEAALDALHP